MAYKLEHPPGYDPYPQPVAESMAGRLTNRRPGYYVGFVMNDGRWFCWNHNKNAATAKEGDHFPAFGGISLPIKIIKK